MKVYFVLKRITKELFAISYGLKYANIDNKEGGGKKK